MDTCTVESECDPPNNLFTDKTILNPYINVSEKLGSITSYYVYFNILNILFQMPTFCGFKGIKGVTGSMNLFV